MRAKFADTGLNAIIEPGARVKLGSNAPIRTVGDDGQVTYRFTSDPSQVDAVFNSMNTFLQRRGLDPLTREQFDSSNEYHVKTNPVVEFSLPLRIPQYSRSLVKTAMAMAFSVGVKPADCVTAVPYLRNEALDEEGVVKLFPTSLEGALENWTDYHAVNIFGLPSERTLLAEVIYFGTLSGLVTLSNSFEGAQVIAGHSINLKTGEIVDVDLNIPDFYLPANRVMELLRSRIGRFKSPMMLSVLPSLGPVGINDN